MEQNEINTLENRLFRLECEQFVWREFRSQVENYFEMKSTFGFNTTEETENLKKALENIKYY